MPVTQVQWLTQLNAADLESICDATAEAIQNGIGFDWIRQPPRDRLEAYWRGVMLVPDRLLLVGRFDGVIAGTGQLVKPSANNEAGAFNAVLSTFFVAPWARGHGLARAMLREIARRARDDGFLQISLDVRETQAPAIQLYEGAGFRRWGIKERYAKVGTKYIRGFFYTKDLTEP
jgi:ribosomal protein S18 acetylase RimI-like enzyme